MGFSIGDWRGRIYIAPPVRTSGAGFSYLHSQLCAVFVLRELYLFVHIDIYIYMMCVHATANFIRAVIFAGLRCKPSVWPAKLVLMATPFIESASLELNITVTLASDITCWPLLPSQKLAQREFVETGSPVVVIVTNIIFSDNGRD